MKSETNNGYLRTNTVKNEYLPPDEHEMPHTGTTLQVENNQSIVPNKPSNPVKNSAKNKSKTN